MEINGATLIRKLTGEITMNQSDNTNCLSVPTTDKAFSLKRAISQYVGINCRSDICGPVQPVVVPGMEATARS